MDATSIYQLVQMSLDGLSSDGCSCRLIDPSSGQAARWFTFSAFRFHTWVQGPSLFFFFHRCWMSAQCWYFTKYTFFCLQFASLTVQLSVTFGCWGRTWVHRIKDGSLADGSAFGTADQTWTLCLLPVSEKSSIWFHHLLKVHVATKINTWGYKKRETETQVHERTRPVQCRSIWGKEQKQRHCRACVYFPEAAGHQLVLLQAVRHWPSERVGLPRAEARADVQYGGCADNLREGREGASHCLLSLFCHFAVLKMCFGYSFVFSWYLHVSCVQPLLAIQEALRSFIGCN